MNYPDEAKAAAAGYLGVVIAKSLHEAGFLPAEVFLRNVAGACESLANSGEEITANALHDLVTPLADLMDVPPKDS